MPIDLQQYWSDVQPINLLSLIDEDVLLHLLNGFSYGIGAGVSVLFPTTLPATVQNMGRRDARGDSGERQFYHPFCSLYRAQEEHDALCKDFDAGVAVKYYSNEWEEPILCRCYMQLWDMSYPLKAHGRLLGVLFAGQIIVRDENVRWRERLNTEHLTVQWDTFDPRSTCQIRDICAAIDQRVRDPFRPNLQRIVLVDPDGKNTDLPTLLVRWEEFRQFGRMMESLLTRLYERTVSGAKERILNQIGAELISHTTSQDAWWCAVCEVTRALQEVAGVEQVDVYSRAGSRYVQQVCAGQVVEQQAARRVPVSFCVWIPTEELVRIEDFPCAADVRKAFGVPEGGYVYKRDYRGLESRTISTILLLRGNLEPEETRKFAADFCHRVSFRGDVRELLFQIDTDRRSFADQARRAAHASRTPLQIALSDIELAEVERERGQDPEYAALMDRVMDRISDAEREISELLTRVPHPRRALDIREIALRLGEEMKPLARRRQCRIVVDVPSSEVRCRVSEPEIHLALRELLDNAIKYSFNDYEVRIRMNVVHGSVVIVFSNYGVGIPEEKLREIREIGERGEVFDPRQRRGGFGVGLSIAIRDIELHGGSLDMESHPADPGPRAPGLRFVTKVTVTLPLAEG